MEYLILFTAMFAQVFLLGVNSQVVRDGRVYMAFFVSWGIWTGQYFFVTVVATAKDPLLAYLFGGTGAAIGISLSIICYAKYLKPKQPVSS